MATRAFPQDPDSFPDDPRVSFSKQTQTYILEDDDGNEWEWLPGPQKWSKTVRITFRPSSDAFLDDGALCVFFFEF